MEVRVNHLYLGEIEVLLADAPGWKQFLIGKDVLQDFNLMPKTK